MIQNNFFWNFIVHYLEYNIRLLVHPAIKRCWLKRYYQTNKDEMMKKSWFEYSEQSKT